MTTKNRTFKEAIVTVSAGKVCSLSGCERPRYAVSRFCKHHYNHARSYGTPTQRNIREMEYLPFIEPLEAIITKNENTHQGILNALDFFKAWMLKAADGDKDVAGYKYLKAAYEDGLTPKNFLATTAALYRLFLLQPQSIEEGKGLVFIMGRALARLGKSYRKKESWRTGNIYFVPPSAKELREMGTYVLGAITPLLMNLSNTIDKQTKAIEQKKLDQWAEISF